MKICLNVVTWNHLFTEIRFEIEELDLERDRIDYFVGGYVEPTTGEGHPACRGCHNYHGRKFIWSHCGLRYASYRIEDETCPRLGRL